MRTPARRNVVLLIACLALAANCQSVLADDDLADRLAAARRYMSVVPVSRMLDDSVSELAKQVPDEKRAEFIRQMHSILSIDVLERATLNAMVKVFTVEELNALSDFYGSKAGRSAMDKFGIYMAEIVPVFQQEIQRALQQQPRPR